MAGCLGTGTIWRLGAEPSSPLQEPCLRRLGTGTGVGGSLTFGLVIVWRVQPRSLPFPRGREAGGAGCFCCRKGQLMESKLWLKCGDYIWHHEPLLLGSMKCWRH